MKTANDVSGAGWWENVLFDSVQNCWFLVEKTCHYEALIVSSQTNRFPRELVQGTYTH